MGRPSDGSLSLNELFQVSPPFPDQLNEWTNISSNNKHLVLANGPDDGQFLMSSVVASARGGGGPERLAMGVKCGRHNGGRLLPPTFSRAYGNQRGLA